MPASPEPLEERLARLTDALRQTSRDTPLAIDNLLHAVARQDEQLQHEAGKQAGEIAVALDAITRWIGNAERRFDALEETDSRDRQLIARVATLAEAQGHILQRQNATVTDRLCKADAAIAAIEHKLHHIEHRLEADKPKQLTQQVTALSWQLDLQSRLTTRNTQSSIRYFELMTAQIEVFAGELRQLRAESHEARKKTELLPELGKKIEQLAEEHLRAPGNQNSETPDNPAMVAINERLDQAINRLEDESKAARIARESTLKDMETLRQSIRQLEELGRSLSVKNAALAQAVDPYVAGATSSNLPSQDTHIRSTLIAAARQAVRGEQDGRGMERSGNRFLRTAASDDI